MNLQNNCGNTQSRVNIVIAVVGSDVRDIKISDIARLQINTERTDESVT